MPDFTTSTPRAALMALLGLLFAVLPAQAVPTFICNTSVTTAGPANHINFSQGTPCLASDNTLKFASAMPASSSARALAGLGRMAGDSSTQTSDTEGDGRFIHGSAYAQLDDRLVVSGLGPLGASLRFGVGLSGALASEASARNNFNANTANASFEFRASLVVNGGSERDDLRIAGCTKSIEPGISVCNGNFDFLATGSISVNRLADLTVFVHNGDIIDLGLSLQTFSFVNLRVPDATGQAAANFLDGVRWLGLNFSTENAGVVLSSESGFDYRLAAPAAVPEPASWALFALGIMALGWRRRAELVSR